jgi:DNA repair exonuclease SbcCD nuclease subunit
MIKLLHTADLHLKAPPSEDSSYSLECLEILINTANTEEVDGVLLCGDIFDKESDYRDHEFCQKVIAVFNIAKMPLYYIPGNHEDHAGVFSKLKTINWGKNIQLITDIKLIQLAPNLEILAIPHRLNYEDYTEWEVPKKVSAHRIAIAHGELPGFTFLGDEDGAGVLNPAIFVQHKVSHVYLGHIHLDAQLENSGVSFYYAGSARPVRRRETGVRGYNIIEIDSNIKVQRRDFKSMGVIKNIRSSVLDQNWTEDIEESCSKYFQKDRIHLILEGMVEDMQQTQIKIDQLLTSLNNKFRRVTLDTKLEPLETLIQNPFYKKVYERWLLLKPVNQESREFQVWLQMLNSLKFLREKVIK